MKQTPTGRYWYVLKFILLLLEGKKQQDLQPEMNNKIFHMKWLQKTKPDGLGALTFLQCTRTLCLPPTTYLFL